MHLALVVSAIAGAAIAVVAPPPPGAAAASPPGAPRTALDPTETCRGCHPQVVEEHLASHHERAWTNPLFQAQYFQEVLPLAATDPDAAAEARRCVACHAPEAVARGGPLPAAPGDVPASVTGVTCDACHVAVGLEGRRPGDGNLKLQPGPTKFGPIKAGGDWHHAYGELQTKSELCAACHEASNHHAVAIASTWSEWKASPQAARGLQCQDCHMTVDGFTGAAGPHFRTGSVTEIFGKATEAREALHTHRFPGAHSRTQVEGAMGLTIAVTPLSPEAGGPLDLQIAVDNSRAGHATPTGFAFLRLLWLEVTLEAGGRTIPVPASSRWGAGWADGIYEIAGAGPLDAAVLGADVPKGSRVYRVLLGDAAGQPTQRLWEGRRVIADSRLKAGEVRTERYRLVVPADAPPVVTVRAQLRYLTAPRSFTDRYGQPPAEPVVVAVASRDVEVRPAPPRAAPP